MYLLNLGAINLYIRGFCHLVNILNFIGSIIKTIALTKLYLAGFLFLLLLGILESVILHNLISGQFTKRLIT